MVGWQSLEANDTRRCVAAAGERALLLHPSSSNNVSTTTHVTKQRTVNISAARSYRCQSPAGYHFPSKCSGSSKETMLQDFCQPALTSHLSFAACPLAKASRTAMVNDPCSIVVATASYCLCVALCAPSFARTPRGHGGQPCSAKKLCAQSRVARSTSPTPASS